MTDPRTPSPTETREVGAYCDALLQALRMRDVPGDRIGAVLTEVRAHLADSGEDPVEAFGTPEGYADALAGEAPARTRRSRVAEALTGAAFVLGVCWLLEGAVAAATGEGARLGPVAPLSAAVAALGAPWVLAELVSASRVRMARGIGAFVVAAAGLGALGMLAGEDAGLPVPTAVPLVLGALALALGAGTVARTADPVVSPFDSPGDVQARRRRSGRLLTALLLGQLLVLMAVVVVMSVVVGSGG